MTSQTDNRPRPTPPADGADRQFVARELGAGEICSGKSEPQANGDTNRLETEDPDLAPRQVKAQLKALIADDHWVVRASIVSLLGTVYDVTPYEASNADETVAICRDADKLDLIVVDLRMPGQPTQSLLRDLSELSPGAPVIVLSISEDRSDVLLALQHGAAGYIPKTAEPAAILDAVARVLRGEAAIPQDLLFKKATPQTAMADDADLGKVFAAVEMFTPRQREIFGLLASGLSNKEMATQLGLSVNTIRAHLQAISARLPGKGRSKISSFASRWRERAHSD